MGIFKDYVNEISTCEKCQQAYINNNKIKCNSSDINNIKLFNLKGFEAAKECERFMPIVIKDYRQITLDRALKFMLAGQSHFKIVSGKTGKEFYYKIIKKEVRQFNNNYTNKYIYWINGGIDDSNLKYLGTVYFNNKTKRFDFYKGINGTENKNSQIVKAILYLINKLYKGEYNTNIQLFHNGTCGMCGRQLTEISSIVNGLDSSCYKKCDISLY